MNYTQNRGRGREHITRSAFGGKLRALRNAKGLTQWQVADLVMVHLSYICKLECGLGGGPSRRLILKLAGALGGDADELLALAGKSDKRAELEARDVEAS